MRLWVKLCGLRTEEEVQAALEAAADAVGFVLTASPRRVDLAQAARLASLVPEGTATVAVYHRPDPALIAETRRILDPHLYQAEPVALGPVPADQRLPVVVDGPELAERGASALASSAGMVLVDSAARGGTGRAPNWSRIADVPWKDGMVLAGGLDPANVAEAVIRVRPFGVDVSSGIERSPGEKDPLLMSRFVRAARDAPRRGEVLP